MHEFLGKLKGIIKRQINFMKKVGNGKGAALGFYK